MRTVAVTKIGSLRDPDESARGRIGIVELPEQPLGPEDVRVRVAYSAICGSDPHLAEGFFGTDVPIGLGHELSGVVEAVGDGVRTGIRVGDRIAGNFLRFCGSCGPCRDGRQQFCEFIQDYNRPGMAETVTWHESQVYKLPDSVSLRRGCLLEPTSVAVRIADKAGMRVGDRVAICGGGPIGQLALQVMRLNGATSLTLIEPIAERREMALAAGAQHVIDPITEDQEARTAEITGGRGYDVVIDASGSTRAVRGLLDLAAKGGTVVYGAMYPHDFEMPLNLSDFLYLKELTLTGVFVSPYAFPRAVQLLPLLDLDALTATDFPLDQAVEAFAAHLSGEHPKVLIRCNDVDEGGAVTAALQRDVAEAAPALEAVGIEKHFDGVYALSGARLSVRPGEIHALLGENGAGKSTLIKIVTGLYAPDEGEVRRNGEPVVFHNVRAAHGAGVVALYQELSIIPTISVAENILLGEETPSRGGLVNWGQLNKRAAEQLARLNQRIPLRKLAGELSPVQQTMVAVARALATDARVLILDEPTASLTDTEITDLFTVLRRLRDEGVAIVYVSHRLEEVFELCDRLTVMRNGETIVTKSIAETNIDEVISTMVGRPHGLMYPERDTATRDVVLQVNNLTGSRVQDVSFQAHAGEVLGIGGLAGSGRSELLRLLAGAQKRASGEVVVAGTALTHLVGVGRALDAGMALVPEERRSQGVILHNSIQDNIAVANIPTVSRGGWVNNRAIARIARSALGDLQIKARGPRQPVGQLSGGNQQKVVLAKMLSRRPKVLLMDEPTRGIDVGTKAEIYRLIRRLAANGTTVVAVSSELPELIGMSDRILIMHQGRVSGEVQAADADEEILLTFAYGRTA